MNHLKGILLLAIATLLTALTTACGGIGGQTIKYTVGVNVSGLNGTLILQNNGENSLTVSQNGLSVFSTSLENGKSYNVTIATHPKGQTCWTDNGTGTISSADATNILVECKNGAITLNGRISVPAGVLVDSDVNDPNAKYESNDTIISAQILPNPVSIGGYVNRALSGATGRSFSIGDENDYFRVQLKAGDAITLMTSTSDTRNNDLDLHLYDISGKEIDFSMGTGTYELLHAPADGIYFVRIHAFSGASNYILTIDTDTFNSTAAEADVDILSSQRESIPGQIVVSFTTQDQTNQTMSSTQPVLQTMADLNIMGLTIAAGASDREMLLTVDTATPIKAYTEAGATKKLYDGEVSDGQDMADSEKTWLHHTFETIKTLRQREDVAVASPNYILRNFATPSDDPDYIRQWNHQLINLPEAWDYATGDDNVIVAVLDTGVLMEHPDLSSRLTNTGYDFVKDSVQGNDGNGIDPNPTDPGNGDYGSLSSFHGTHCIGIIAAATNNAIGIAGITWNTKIMPVRVMGKDNTGSSYDIRQGIRYAAGMSNDSKTTPARPADIISMSFGGTTYDPLDQALLKQVRSKGIIAIAAAGNDNASRPKYPAAYDGVISVSAVDTIGNKTYYSNYGPSITLAAPGGNPGDLNNDGYSDGVWSTSGNDTSGSIIYNYRAMTGTSMAAPHVAGVVALMKAIYPALTPRELDDMIIAGMLTIDIGPAGRDDYYGYGLINAFKAVGAAHDIANGRPITGIDVNPKTINFGIAGLSAMATVLPIGNRAIYDIKVSNDAEWLTITPSNVDFEGFGTYRFDVDRSLLSKGGAYATTVTFIASSGESTTIAITVQARPEDTADNMEHLYVLLISVGSNDVSRTVAVCNVEAYAGQYFYSFTNVMPGTYRIIAGSDRNNNGYLADAGEILGAYYKPGQIMDIEVADTSHSLYFTTDLQLSLKNTFADQNIPPEGFSRLVE